MNYLEIVKQIIEDNGFIRGAEILFFLLSQKFLKIPREKNYRYKSKILNKEILMNYTADISSGFSLAEIFGIAPYYRSTNGRINYNLNKESKVLDLGGFVGDSTLFFALQGAFVHSFEPQKKASLLMEKNLKINNLGNVRIYNSAVTSDGRRIKMKIDNKKISDRYSLREQKRGLVMKTKSFSEVLNEESFWDLIKIDIEGGEWEIMSFLTKNKRFFKQIGGLIIELHSPIENRTNLRKFLECLKFLHFEIEMEIRNDLGMIWARRVVR